MTQEQKPNLSQRILESANRLADRMVQAWKKANEAFEKSPWPKKISAKANHLAEKYKIREN